jgi:hypothetical protein
MFMPVQRCCPAAARAPHDAGDKAVSQKQKQPLQNEPPKQQKSASEGLRDDVRVRAGIERQEMHRQGGNRVPDMNGNHGKA